MIRQFLVSAAMGLAPLCIVLPISVMATDFSTLLENINLKPGFKISIFAQMPKPRQIEVDTSTGEVFVGSRQGHIYSLVDSNGDGVADKVGEIARNLNVPNAIALHDHKLFVGLLDKIAYWPIESKPGSLLTSQSLKTINKALKAEFHHGWRTLNFGPDGLLYIALGAPCNICELEKNTGKIVRMNPDGSGWEMVADGVRNSVGFDWHPKTGELWFTDNGADRMGDDIPADELNRVTKVGQHFGFPYRGGKSVRLTGYRNKKAPLALTPPEIEFQAHTASLGIEFYQGDMFPGEYLNDAFVAQHGSWNRSQPVGYRIMRIRFDDQGNAVAKEVFADGWLQNGVTKGRPVDLEELPDGSLLVSDDFANVIYRISYDK